MPSKPLPLHSRALRRRPKKRRWLRRSLLIVFGLALAWVVGNRFDAAPSAASVQLSQPLTRAVADADNAWLYLYGLGAAENEDPIRLGRARVDALNRVAEKSLIVVPDKADWPLMRDALPLAQPDPAVDSSGELCPSFYQVNCLDWVRGHAAMLQRLGAANRVQLQRVAVLLALPQWEDLQTPSMSERSVEADVRALHLYSDLLAQQVNQALDGNDAAGLARALQQIAAVSAFWHRLAQRPSSVLASVISNQQRARQLRLLADILDRLDADQLAALKAPVDTILQPTLPVDWSLVLRREFQIRRSMQQFVIPDLDDSARRCGTGELASCGHVLANLGFARQDTLNRTAENLQDFQRELEAAPGDFGRISAQAVAARESRRVDLNHPLNLIGAVLYNPLGKLLVGEMVPGHGHERTYEIEALRRSVALKRAAVAANLAPADMPAFLGSQSAELRNPFTGQPFDWDPRQREIHFRPVSDFWKMPRLGVTYRELPQAGVQACAQPQTLELTTFDGDTARPPQNVVSCGGGALAFSDDTATPYAAVQVLLADGKLDARVLQRTKDKQVRPYEVLDAAFDGSQEVWLAASGSEAPGQRIRLRRAEEQKTLPLITLAVTAQPARALLQDIARLGQVRIDGTELAGENRLSLRNDLPPYNAVQQVADAGGLQAERVAEGHFVLKKKAP